MAFIDFAELKQAVAIDSQIAKLGLEGTMRGEQWRGPCPACRSGGKRALVITPSKSAFYCFGGQTGGDVIALVAHIKACSMKQAAEDLAAANGLNNAVAVEKQSQFPEERNKEAARSLQPLAYLQAEHPNVQALGLDPETCDRFGAGYAPKGIMRGMLAIPIYDQTGSLVAYCGQSIKSQIDPLKFPKGFDPTQHLFGLQQVQKGTLVLAHDPLEVLRASQNGIENAVSFLTDALSTTQLELLHSIMTTFHLTELELA